MFCCSGLRAPPPHGYGGGRTELESVVRKRSRRRTAQPTAGRGCKWCCTTTSLVACSHPRCAGSVCPCLRALVGGNGAVQHLQRWLLYLRRMRRLRDLPAAFTPMTSGSDRSLGQTASHDISVYRDGGRSAGATEFPSNAPTKGSTRPAGGWMTSVAARAQRVRASQSQACYQNYIGRIPQDFISHQPPTLLPRIESLRNCWIRGATIAAACCRTADRSKMSRAARVITHVQPTGMVLTAVQFTRHSRVSVTVGGHAEWVFGRERNGYRTADGVASGSAASGT
ncbi:hypothetical protein BV20DRAFT_824949 [Pilatotrama ljubarskyi]|nr:hypothetical protein BV20DRAFT_824949 [Pilatotrama ljubarskyi]